MNNNTIDILTYLLIFMVSILAILLIVFIILKVKEKNDKKSKEKIKKQDEEKQKSDKQISHTEYNKQSIFSFMEFEKIEDNMIVKKEGKTYLMVIECQGINYDLMSGVEQTSVEQGFLQFLNTLRYPIQIYTQTRTVNLGNSINTYKERIKSVKDKLVRTEMEYRQRVNEKIYSKEELEKFNFEVIKQRNLYEYGLDIVRNTEQMSFNKNILTKQYYIIIKYYPEDLENREFSKEEIKNIAFSELYTKAQAIVSSLFVCGVNSKILDSRQLMELLYIAYNRDEAEVYELNKALNSGYEELYSTAPDVLDKRMKALDQKIEEEAIRKANDMIMEVLEENEKERAVKEKENKMNKLIEEMTGIIIEQNKALIGKDVTKKVQEKLKNKNSKEGGRVDEEKTKNKTTRKSRKSI